MKYIRKILDNGMNIILVPMKNTHIISMGFFVKAGSRNETENNNGVAHFLEHMMFKGTTHRTAEQLFNEMDTLGAMYNAATTAQSTYYYIYGNSDDTKIFMDIIFDIYLNAAFSAKEILKEKKVIIEEMRMRFDSPLIKLYSRMHKKFFKNTSLERDIIGTKETVLNLNKKDLTQFRDSLYKPENTVFVIAGSFSPKPVYEIAKRVLAPLKNSLEIPQTYFNEKTTIFKNFAEQKEPYVYIKKNLHYQQVYIIVAFPMYDLYQYKHREIDLLSQLLSGGFSSRLTRALRENNGITYVSTTYPIVYSDCGLFLAQMVLNPMEFKKGLKILLGELNQTKIELMTTNELKKIVNLTKNETMYSLALPIDFLTYFGINFLSNRAFNPNLNKDFEELNKITREQIMETAGEIFSRNKLNIFIYGNIDETNFDFLNSLLS